MTIIIISFSGCGLFSHDRKDVFEFQGEEYRTPAAHEALIGSIGVKRKEGKGRYELKFMPAWENLEIANTTNFAENYVKNLDEELGLSVGIEKIKKVADAKVAIDAKEASQLNRKGEYHLWLIADRREAVRQLNQQEDVLQYIARDPRYRLVVSTLKVYGHDEDIAITKSNNLNIELDAASKGNASLKIGKSEGEKKEISLSEGTRYAYNYARFCWEVLSDNKVKLYDIMVDREAGSFFGLGSDKYSCPEGTHYSVAEAIRKSENKVDKAPPIPFYVEKSPNSREKDSEFSKFETKDAR